MEMRLEDRDRITDGRPPATEEIPPPMTLRTRLGWVVGYLVFAFVFGGHTPRSIPGGPTLSVTGDILPATSAVLAILLSFVLLRHRSALVKTIAFALVAVGAVAFSLIVIDVVVFQVRPYQRGPRLGL